METSVPREHALRVHLSRYSFCRGRKQPDSRLSAQGRTDRRRRHIDYDCQPVSGRTVFGYRMSGGACPVSYGCALHEQCSLRYGRADHIHERSRHCLPVDTDSLCRAVSQGIVGQQCADGPVFSSFSPPVEKQHREAGRRPGYQFTRIEQTLFRFLAEMLSGNGLGMVLALLGGERTALCLQFGRRPSAGVCPAARHLDDSGGHSNPRRKRIR